jgi:hypothetical protein
MSSDRLFFKLHNGFPEHPKAFELSDKAFRQLIEAWCYCSRNLNDGKLTKTQFSKLFSAKSRKELLTVGFVKESGSGYEMHDYLEHQQSAEDVENRRMARAVAGSKGGKAKANGLANAKQTPEQTPSKSVADTDTDPDIDPNTPANAGVRPRKRASRISEDFSVTPEMRLWASSKAPGADLATETEKFINYWVAKSGKDATKLDWAATWRNWILNAKTSQIRPDHSSRGIAKGMAMLQAYDAQQTQPFELEA